jgi:hypothetical protein
MPHDVSGPAGVVSNTRFPSELARRIAGFVRAQLPDKKPGQKPEEFGAMVSWKIQDVFDVCTVTQDLVIRADGSWSLEVSERETFASTTITDRSEWTEYRPPA